MSDAGLRAAWRAGATRIPVDAASLLAFIALVVFLLQALTGTLLAFYYRPTMDGAHESVVAITGEVRWGWLYRSLHSWGAHLLASATLGHLLARFLSGGHRAPRRLPWLLAVAGLFAVLAAAFTGQFLPLDQEAYQGAVIAASQAGPLAAVVRGGDAISDATVGRFFAVHVLVIPGLLAAIWALRGILALQRDAAPAGKGLTPGERLGVAALGAALLLAILAVAFPPGVGPKADATSSIAGVKPSWVFLPLYMAMNVGWLEKVVMLVPPVFLIAAPFLDRAGPRLVRAAGILIVIGLAALGVAGAVK